MYRYKSGGFSYLESMSRDDSDVGGHAISELDFDEVAQHELLGTHVQLVAVSNDDGELNTHNNRFKTAPSTTKRFKFSVNSL